MNKKLLISFVLSSTLCAPYARAMSGLLPRARQVAAMVMNPGVRAALTQTSRTVTNTARNASRAVPEIVQPVRQPMTQSISRSFTTQAPRTAQTAQQSGSRLAAGVGLAGLIGGGLTYAQAESQQNPFPKDFLTTTDKDTLLQMIRKDSEYFGLRGLFARSGYAQQLADLVTAENMTNIDGEVLLEIIKQYPRATKTLGMHLKSCMETNSSAMIFQLVGPDANEGMSIGRDEKGNTLWHERTDTLSRRGWQDFFIQCMKDNAALRLQCINYLGENIARVLKTSAGLDLHRRLIREILKSDEKSAVIFMQYLATELILGGYQARTNTYCLYNVYELMNEVIKNNTAAATVLTSYTAQNLDTIGADVGFIQKMIDIYPESIDLFTECAVRDFAEIQSRYNGDKLLALIIEKNPKAIALFTNYAIENFATLMQHHAPQKGLKFIMDCDPKSVGAISACIIKDFNLWIESYCFKEIGALIMEKNPAICPSLADLALKRLFKGDLSWTINYRAERFIEGAITNVEFAKCFAHAVGENINMVIQHEKGLDVIQKIMVEDINFTHYFTPYALQHVPTLIKSKQGISFLGQLVENDETRKQYLALAGKYMNILIDHHNLLQHILNAITSGDDADLARSLKEQFVLQIPEMAKSNKGIMALSNIVLQYAEMRDVIKKGVEALDSSSADQILKLIDKITEGELTPTELGFLYAEKEISARKKEVLKDPIIKQVIDTVIALEKKYDQTHYTFTHGRNRAYDYVSTVYGALWKYAYNREVPEDFIFTHTKDAHDPLMRRVVMHQERKLHEANIKERENISGEVRNRRLFLNTQLFGNMDVRGSSSFSYFLHSSNASGQVKVTVEDTFAQFDQSAIYEKYKDEFQALEKEHTKLSRQGELLVVAVPKDRVNQDVTCMTVHGRAAPQYMINGKMTNNVREILQARKKDPSIGDNELNFTLAMTDTAALNPASGIKIHSIQGVDRETYAAWQAKLDALMVKIEAEFKDGWNQKVADARVRHQPIYDAIKPVENAAIFHRMKNMNAEQQHPGSIYPGHSGSANYAGQGK